MDAAPSLAPAHIPAELRPALRPPPSHRHPAAVYLASRAPGESRRSARGALERIARELSGGRADAGVLPWTSIRYAHVAALRAHLAEQLKPGTVNKILAALRGVMREAWRLDLVPADVYQRIADVQGVPGRSLRPGRALAVRERRALYAACHRDRYATGAARDAALIALLDGCGLRRAELAALELRDLGRDARTIDVRKGKGRKERRVPVPRATLEALDAWLEHRGDEPGPLLFVVNKGGAIRREGISSQAVYNVVRRRRRDAGIRPLTPHDFRRTLIGDLFGAGVDVATIAGIVGHAHIHTTATYDRRGEEARQAAIDLRAIPYVRPSTSTPREASATQQDRSTAVGSSGPLT